MSTTRKKVTSISVGYRFGLHGEAVTVDLASFDDVYLFELKPEDMQELVRQWLQYQPGKVAREPEVSV